uniref:Uncharacterized protein n=1 Tax=viral metagenome TaxID=1070528 RepID=A0A6C0D1E2_9ZZZZ
MTSSPPPSDNLPILCPQSYFNGGDGKIVWTTLMAMNPNSSGNCIYTTTNPNILKDCSKTTLFVASRNTPPPLTNGICNGTLKDGLCTTNCMWTYSPRSPL